MNTRRSFWRTHLARARKTGDWYEIPRFYTRVTAAQLASDLRGGRRVVGMEPGERWEATWDSSDDPADDYKCTVRIKLLETVHAESAEA